MFLVKKSLLLKQKRLRQKISTLYSIPKYIYFLKFGSSDTVNFFLPCALRDANTLRPLGVSILERNPCLFFLFLFEG